jgi:uncharacterized protein with PIN domain
MNEASFTFYAELNDFLPKKWQNTSFRYAFEEHQTVKHVIECLGVPHNEVNHLRANEGAVGFSYHVHEGDLVHVFPVSSPPEPRDIVLQADPGSISSFVLDNHLGRLAAYLRMLGFDTLYRNDYQDEELAQVTDQEGRILLTRDRRLLMRKVVVYGYCIRSMDPRRQVGEILRRFGLFGKITPFRRCLRCNHPLQSVSKDAILDRLEPLTKRYYDEFHLCPACNQVYWKGSHYVHMQDLIETVTQDNLMSG